LWRPTTAQCQSKASRVKVLSSLFTSRRQGRSLDGLAGQAFGKTLASTAGKFDDQSRIWETQIVAAGTASHHRNVALGERRDA